VINDSTSGGFIQGINKALAKIAGPNSPIVASDLGEFGKKTPVRVLGHQGSSQRAEVITQAPGKRDKFPNRENVTTRKSNPR
jgi:hypothetical protein